MTISFADDCRWLLTTDLVEQLCQGLKIARIKAVEWGKKKHVVFDNS